MPKGRALRPDLSLEQVVEAGGFGPTGAHGGEGWVRRVTVVAGRERMRRVAELTGLYVKLLQDLLELPDHHDVYAAATIGFPAVKLHSVPPRETRARWLTG